MRDDIRKNILAKVEPILGKDIDLKEEGDGLEDWYSIDAKRELTAEEIFSVSGKFQMAESPASTNVGATGVINVYYPLSYRCKICNERYGELRDVIVHVYKGHPGVMTADQRKDVEGKYPEVKAAK